MIQDGVWLVPDFLLPLVAVLVANAIQKHGYPRFVALAKRLRERWAAWQRGRRWRASQLRSVAGFNENTRATIELQALFKEWDEGKARRKREDAHAYEVPYWELYTAQQLGTTVSEYRSLPLNERLAWKLYFELDEKTRRHAIKDSQEWAHEELMKRMQEYKERESESAE